MASIVSSAVSAVTGTAGTIADASAGKEHPADTISHDPILIQLTWAVALVTLVIALGKPIRDYLRGERSADKNEKVQSAKTEAETTLYTHLSEQVSQYRTIADQAFRERNDLISRVANLEAKAEDLEESRELVANLKARLDHKDEEMREMLQEASKERKQFLDILQAKDSQIASRDERILSLETGFRELELRLARSEASSAPFSCPLATITNQGA